MKSEIFRSVCFTLISLLFSSYNIKSTWSIRVNTSLTDRIPWKPIPTPVNRRGFVSSAEDAVSFPTPNLNTYTSQPVLKQRENGASLGLDIPESNLRLWLNIDELSGPKGENVRLKLLDADSLAKSSSTPRYSAPLIPPLPPSSPSGPAPTGTLSAKLQKKYQIGYIRATDLHSALNSGVLPPGSKAYPVPPPPVFLTHNTNSMRKQQQQHPSPQPQLAHLPIPIPSPPSSHSDPPSHQHQHHPQNHPLPSHHPSSSFMESFSSSASNGGFAQPILKYSQPLQSDSLSTVEKHVNNYPSSSNSVVEPQQQPFLPINHQPSASPPPAEVTSSLSSSTSLSSSSSSPNAGDQIGGLSVAESMSKTNTRPSSPSAPVKSARKKSRNKGSSAARKSSQLQEAPSTTSTTTTTTTTTTTEATSTTDYKADLRIEQQKQADISEEDVQEVQITQNQQSEQVRDEQQDDDFVGLMQAQVREEPSSTTSTSTTPSTTTTTTTTQASAAIKGLPPPRAPVKGRRPAAEAQRAEAQRAEGQRSGRLRDVNSVDDSTSSTETEDDDGFELLRMTPRNPTSSSSSSSSHSDSCSPDTSSFSGDAESMTIREFASKLGADALFSKFPAMEDHLQNMVDFMNSGYTLFLPSNEAVERIPRSLVRKLKSDPELLKRMLENHVSEDKRDMSADLRVEMVMPARVSSGRLRVSRRSQTESLHVNGVRILKMNQKGPMGGSVNVVDGLLYPVADRNLMDTLKGCNRFDGFVTLAEGTGLGESLASGKWSSFSLAVFSCDVLSSKYQF